MPLVFSDQSYYEFSTLNSSLIKKIHFAGILFLGMILQKKNPHAMAAVLPWLMHNVVEKIVIRISIR